MVPWWLEPLILIIFTALATQWGAKFAQSVLDDLRRNSDRHSYPDSLSDTLKRRADELETAEGKTIDSFLNQVIATWSAFILACGLSIALFFRPNAGIRVMAAVGLAVVVIGLLALSTYGLIRAASLMDYYNKQSPGRSHSLTNIIPPATVLTGYRIATFLVYAILVFGSYWPAFQTKDEQAKDKPATLAPATTVTPTPTTNSSGKRE